VACGRWIRPPRRKHQGEAGRVEHAGLGIDGFAKELGTDERMVAAFFSDNAVDVNAVSGNEKADIIGGEEEDTLDAVLLLRLEG